jgi:glycosyltransferase involved in cell wall biosynthesis
MKKGKTINDNLFNLFIIKSVIFMKICVVTQPLLKKSNQPLIDRLMSVLSYFTKDITLVTSNLPDYFKTIIIINCINIPYDEKNENILKRLFKFFKLNIEYFKKIRSIQKENDIFIFYLATGFFFHILYCRLIGKKTIIEVTGSGRESVYFIYKKSLFGYGGRIFSTLFSVLEKLSLMICDNIVIYGPSQIHQLGLEPFKSKTFYGPEHNIDLKLFTISIPYINRKQNVGFVGRLSPEKGIEKIFQLAEMNDPTFEIHVAGDGPLKKEIIELEKHHKHLHYDQWIRHKDIPLYLNQLKLLIIPSETEGLPNVMLEAMACGTPVLTMAVGAIPDLIKDSKTGFIMQNNSPECIAKNIKQIFDHPNLNAIIENAENLVKTDFTFEAAVRRYSKLLE